MAFIPTNQKLFPSLLLIITTSFLLLAPIPVNSDKIVSFDFPKFTGNESALTLQGDAFIAYDQVYLTGYAHPKRAVGRLLYSTPVPLWDKTTGNVASFVTSFAFLLNFQKTIVPADGLIFFIAPPNSVIPNNAAGGNLGVVDPNTAFNRFVGVEFDNYVNEWDPDYAHIGIDVNSLISSKTVVWKPLHGYYVKVSIAYDSSSKILSVVLTDQSGQLATVAQVVDLKAVLPETVTIGISASTSELCRQIQNIYAWSFTSTLKTTISSITSNNTNNLASYA
ncbi:putative concanavalin A-like lectin/glucanase domain, legume lectin [Medicago truncatula]|nr:legume lectin beta domain protein [Medicago truncatula]RHN66825.1 putative concanavalin A-like lectin/glucanase domain, legume lectin [Medicago truncatula]